MPVTNFNVTGIAHDDRKMVKQLLYEVSCTASCKQVENDTWKTGRIMVLDPEWSILESSADGFHCFLYSSEIEFVLIKTDCEVEFQRIMPTDTKALSACVKWDNRSDEQYYILKVDPVQEVMVAGSPMVRYFRRPKQSEKASMTRTDMWTPDKPVRPWEAEDVNQQRDILTGECYLAEHLVEVLRRFKAWRAKTTNSLFVYLMVPKQLSEAEWIQLLQHGFQFFDDVPWIL